MTSRIKFALLILAIMLTFWTRAALAAGFYASSDPAAKPQHAFADQRTVFGIPNFMDVVSNLPFLVVGLWGLVFVSRADASNRSFLTRAERWPYLILFLGAALTCFGSSYFHLAPSAGRLFWDRLPVTVILMSILAANITERISLKWGVGL